MLILTNVSAMVAAALSGKEILNYTTDFPEGKNRILYIDELRSDYPLDLLLKLRKMARSVFYYHLKRLKK